MGFSTSQLNYILTFLVFVTVLITLISFGFVGRELTYYYELTTEQYKDELPTTYIDSINAIMAWNVFLFLALPLSIYSIYHFSKNTRIALQVLYFLLIWLPRFISSIVFLEAHKDYDSLMTDLYDKYVDDQNACELDMINCVRSNSFVKAQREETAYTIIFFFFGILTIISAYLIGKKKNEDSSSDGRQEKYVEN